MEDILKGLNPNQKEAVTHIGSPLLLLAGAGSGKTRVLTHRVAYFIQQKISQTIGNFTSHFHQQGRRGNEK